MAEPFSLLADIGGTHVRFIADFGDRTDVTPTVYPCRDFASPVEAATFFLSSLGRDDPYPSQAAMAVACPVTGDTVELTNHPWRFSIDGVRQRLGLDRLEVVNDFTAVALALPALRPEDRLQVGGGNPIADVPVAVIGPGTGLGVGGLVSVDGRIRPIPGEGGHVTMAAVDDREARILAILRHRFDHVSAERVISGSGLVNLYRALAEIGGTRAEDLSPAEIGTRALAGSCTHCVEALDTFFAMLGTVAGNLALTFGAGGGIWIGGGIVPRYAAQFANSNFRDRFEAKGRFRAYLAEIPTYLITHPAPAFLGLRAMLKVA